MVYTIAPSPVSAGEIWAGSDTGLIHLTRDAGKTWSNITPPDLADWSKISILDASHFDAGTAYAAVDRHRLDDIGPYIYRTHDFGKTWKKIIDGISNGAYVRTVREDTVHKGLLFAGTELGVYFSLDDGDHWQTLQLNLPVTPVHDLVVKDKDLVVATHGRSFWILDDITPLRQWSKPSTAMRIRASTNHDTPLSTELPAGENPPAGAVIYYHLSSAAQDIRLEIFDATGHVVRQYSSSDQKPFSPPTAPFPAYWFRPPEALSTETGMHRFVWDLRYPPPPVLSHGFSMATVYGRNVPSEPEGPQALPGNYSVKLTVNGQSSTQPLKLVMDPRVATSAQDLQKQFALETKLTQGIQQARRALDEIHSYYVSHPAS